MNPPHESEGLVTNLRGGFRWTRIRSTRTRNFANDQSFVSKCRWLWCELQCDHRLGSCVLVAVHIIRRSHASTVKRTFSWRPVRQYPLRSVLKSSGRLQGEAVEHLDHSSNDNCWRIGRLSALLERFGRHYHVKRLCQCGHVFAYVA